MDRYEEAVEAAAKAIESSPSLPNSRRAHMPNPDPAVDPRGLVGGEFVADCCSEHERHPDVFGDPLAVGLSLDHRGHVAGDAERFDGGLLFGHGRDDSTHAGTDVVVSALSTNGLAALQRPALYSREVTL